jgi:hypothetical protein
MASEREMRKPLYLTVALIGVLNALLIISQYFGFDPVFHSDIVTGFQESTGRSGAYQAIACIVAAKALPLALPLILVSIAMTKSTFSFVAAIAGITYYAFKKNKKIGIVILSLILILSIGWFCEIDKPTYSAFRERFDIWKVSAEKMRDNEIKILGEYPVKFSPFGFGLGSFIQSIPYLPKQGAMNWDQHRAGHPHNEYIYALFELGPFIIVALFMFVCNVIDTYDDMGKAITIAIMILCCGHFFFNVPATAFLGAVLLGANDRRQ